MPPMQDEVFSIDTEEANQHLVDHSTQCIRELYQKYSHDLYLTSKIQHYITNHLPILIANIEESRQRSMERFQELNTEQERFMNAFLQSNAYSYVSSNEKFFHYNGQHYQEVCEDHILHRIVTSISKERNILMEWKHKTKVSTLKKIKETSVFTTIPESNTIQTVLQGCLPYFSSKKKAKYFLTILGDNILKKDLSLIHFVPPSIKYILREINQGCMLYFNVQCTQTFKMKCHEKHYDMDNKACRLVPIVDGVVDETLPDYWKEHILDLLCVACHYSNRYNRSDDFIRIYNSDDVLHGYVLKLCNTSPETMMEEFSKEYFYVAGGTETIVSSSPMDHYIIQCSRTEDPTNVNQHQNQHQTESMLPQISWKSMLYLWKDYLRIHKYPLNLYQPLCKQILTQTIFAKYYNPEEDLFTGIGSSKMPTIYRFLKFWTETVVEDTQEYNELEIDEIVDLFSLWSNKKYSKRKLSLSEEEIIDILHYYYPDVDIEDNKYIYTRRCTLWDKDMDIESAFTLLKESCQKEDKTVSMYDAYTYYCGYFQNKMCVSKSYFEKYMYHRHTHDVSSEGILSMVELS
mgnify:FL=1